MVGLTLGRAWRGSSPVGWGHGSRCDEVALGLFAMRPALAGIPSFGFSALAVDRGDVRAHGKDERLRVSSYYDGVDFYYRYLKALTGTAAN